MKLMIFSLLFSFMSVFVYAQDTIQDSSTKQTFPSQVNFSFDGKDYTLDATGTAVRKKFLVKVYAIASYLQKGAAASGDKFQTVLNPNYAKQLTIKWVHDASVDKLQEGYRESLNKAIPNPNPEQQNLINQFVGFFKQDAKVGDTYTIRWLPGGYVDVSLDGNKTGSLKNEEFAKALWSIWFGNSPAVDRDSLTSRLK